MRRPTWIIAFIRCWNYENKSVYFFHTLILQCKVKIVLVSLYFRWLEASGWMHHFLVWPFFFYLQDWSTTVQVNVCAMNTDSNIRHYQWQFGKVIVWHGSMDLLWLWIFRMKCNWIVIWLEYQISLIYNKN